MARPWPLARLSSPPFSAARLPHPAPCRVWRSAAANRAGARRRAHSSACRARACGWRPAARGAAGYWASRPSPAACRESSPFRARCRGFCRRCSPSSMAEANAARSSRLHHLASRAVTSALQPEDDAWVQPTARERSRREYGGCGWTVDARPGEARESVVVGEDGSNRVMKPVPRHQDTWFRSIGADRAAGAPRRGGHVAFARRRHELRFSPRRAARARLPVQ